MLLAFQLNWWTRAILEIQFIVVDVIVVVSMRGGCWVEGQVRERERERAVAIGERTLKL